MYSFCACALEGLLFSVRSEAHVGFWLKHVKGHSGQKWNDAADSLATRGLDGERHRVYLPREVD